jgi:hypothetical protein
MEIIIKYFIFQDFLKNSVYFQINEKIYVLTEFNRKNRTEMSPWYYEHSATECSLSLFYENR